MNKNFQDNLEASGEVGTVVEVFPSLVAADGLPTLRPNELVIFEGGQLGIAFSILKDKVQVLTLSHDLIRVGDKITKTNSFLSVNISDDVLGKIIDPLGRPINGQTIALGEQRVVDVMPLPFSRRKVITEPLETGVPIVDLIIPIGKGQRELVIGDRKTGKTQFFVKTLSNQSRKGNICIYASVGKKISEVKEMISSLSKSANIKNVVVVATSASDSPGLIFLTPYTAMTIAEYFRDKGKNVILILDDLTNQAMYYRQISLVAGRFPGRNSYPGDIFYLHSKLLERAGDFNNGSITCFPVAESIMGDLSGYIQTNLMSITDGHIFFDTELANLGRRPPINPFLSVTRVGQQAQTPLLRNLSSYVSSFLINLEEIRGFEHFGAELSEETLQKLGLGDRILEFFDQPVDVVPVNLSILVVSMLWIGSWKNQAVKDMRVKMKKMIEDYSSNASGFKDKIDRLMSKTSTFEELLNSLRENNYGQENYY